MKKTILIIVAVVWAMAAKPQAISYNAANIVSDVGSYWEKLLDQTQIFFNCYPFANLFMLQSL